MNASIRMIGPAVSAGLSPREAADVGAPGDLLPDQLGEAQQRIARQCEAQGVAFQWHIAQQCQRIQLSRSELLHVSGVLYELVADSLHPERSRNLRVSFGYGWQRLLLVVEADGADPDQLEDTKPPGDHNLEYLAAQAAGAIRHRRRDRYRACLFWMRVNL